MAEDIKLTGIKYDTAVKKLLNNPDLIVEGLACGIKQSLKYNLSKLDLESQIVKDALVGNNLLSHTNSFSRNSIRPGM